MTDVDATAEHALSRLRLSVQCLGAFVPNESVAERSQRLRGVAAMVQAVSGELFVACGWLECKAENETEVRGG